jgi:hypothetical protein
MLVCIVEGRNEAWHREDVARAWAHELEFYVEDLEEYSTNLHEEVQIMSLKQMQWTQVSSLQMMMNLKRKKKI